MGDQEMGVPPAERGIPGGQPHANDPGGAFARELWDPRVQRKYWLQAMSQAIDIWMRSIPFLELMHQGLQMAAAAKRFQDHWSIHPHIVPPVDSGTACPGPRSSDPASHPSLYSGEKE
jgi:hypothetical protein